MAVIEMIRDDRVDEGERYALKHRTTSGRAWREIVSALLGREATPEDVLDWLYGRVEY